MSSYRINLAREQLARRRVRRASLRVATVCLLIFSALLLILFAVYLARDYQITVLDRSLSVLAKRVERSGVTRQELEILQKRAEKLKARLSSLERTVKKSVPWPAILCALQSSTPIDRVKLTRLTSKVESGQTILQIEGICLLPNSLASIQDFLCSLEKNPVFGRGTLLSVKTEKANPTSFQVEVPLLFRRRPPEEVEQ